MPAATRIGDADVSHCSGMTRAEGSANVFGLPAATEVHPEIPSPILPAPSPFTFTVEEPLAIGAE